MRIQAGFSDQAESWHQAYGFTFIIMCAGELVKYVLQWNDSKARTNLNYPDRILMVECRVYFHGARSLSLCVSQKMSLSGMMITACCATVLGGRRLWWHWSASLGHVCRSSLHHGEVGKRQLHGWNLRTEWCVRRVSSPSLDYDNYT